MQKLQQQEVKCLHDLNAAAIRKLVENQMRKEAKANRKLEARMRTESRVLVVAPCCKYRLHLPMSLVCSGSSSVHCLNRIVDQF